MAQEYPYFRNYESVAEQTKLFIEGPFVLVHVHGWRIEARLIGHVCPALPHWAVYKFMGLNGGKWNRKTTAVYYCDLFNKLVAQGVIVYDSKEKTWVAKYPDWSIGIGSRREVRQYKLL